MSKNAPAPSANAIAVEPPLAIAAPPDPAAGSQRSLWTGYGYAALGAALFSTKAIVIKLAYAEGIGTETLLALRMILALPVYGIVGWLAIRDRRRSGTPLPDRRLVAHAAMVGILGYWFASYADFLGLVYISAQLERLILFTYPAFVVLFGAMFFAQKLRRHAVLGIAISYSGLALIFAMDFGELGADVATGAGFVLAAAIAFAFYQLLSRNLIGRIGPQLFTCIAMSAAALVVLLQFALVEPLSSLAVSPKLFLYGLLLAIGATVVPSFLISAAMHRISAQANSTIGTLSPVVTILLAVAVLGEPFGWIDAAGTALVLAGVGWFTLAERKR